VFDWYVTHTVTLIAYNGEVEPHPVPKNILTVDFKLFGALSIKQFMKVLAGCLLSLIIFASPVPKLISLPLIVLIVIVAVLSALVKDFQVKFAGFLRAIFVSPQYVWRKEEESIDVLNTRTTKVEAPPKAPQTQKELDAESLNDLSIDKILEARNLAQPDAKTEIDTNELLPASNNFDSIYAQTFGPVRKPVSRLESAVNQPIAAMAQTDQLSANSVPTVPLATTTQPSSAESNVAPQNVDIHQEFDKLKSKAAAEVADQVDTATEKSIYGLIVDKQDQPVAGAEVMLLDAKGQMVAPAMASSSDGRFALTAHDLPMGGYIIRIQHPRLSFYDFRINIEDQKLPAYKFKAK
jgi:hypothetical protein